MELADKQVGSENPFISGQQSPNQVFKQWFNQVSEHKKSLYVAIVGIILILTFVIIIGNSDDALVEYNPSNRPARIIDIDEIPLKTPQGFCPVLRSQPEIDRDNPVLPIASPDLNALVIANGFLSILEGNTKGLPEGFYSLQNLKNVTYIESHNKTSTSLSDCAQLILDYDCVRLTFNITHYQKWKEIEKYDPVYVRKSPVLDKEGYILNSFLIQVKYSSNLGNSTVTSSTKWTKLTKFSPMALKFEKGKRLSCLQPVSFYGRALMFNKERQKVYETRVAEIVLARLDIELYGNPEYSELNYFSQDADQESCNLIRTSDRISEINY